jgi:hypothetical protein
LTLAIRALAVGILVALPLHAWTKPKDRRAEMLWTCHACALMVAAGILLGLPLLAGAGFLFHAAIGVPSQLADYAVTRKTSPTSVLVHVLPVAAGAAALAGPALPRGSVVLASAVSAAMIAVAWWLTPPALNVNLAHAPWPPLARVRFLWSRPVWWAVNLGITCAGLALGDWLWGWAWWLARGP